MKEIKNNIRKGISEKQIKTNSPLYPYATALLDLDDTNGNYFLDSAKSIALYFLSNGSPWKGPLAKETKTLIKKEFKIK